ncbi:MAG TPA: alpha/beta fold hydrolase [Chthoniobacterales bacterium]|jgi:pimeloyl-ACP methyl ester carboxylesterase
MRKLPFFAAILILPGCAQIATIKETTPHFAASGHQEQQLQNAARLQQSDPLHALGGYLDSAHSAFDQLRRNPNDKQARDLYNFSVARAIGVIEEANLNPWDRAIKVPAPEGEYSLTSVRPAEPERNPAAYEIIPADSIVIGGTYLDRRVTVPGIGAPVVAVGREENKDFRKTFATRRTYGNATAVIRFSDHRAEIDFVLPFVTDHVSLGGHEYPLAADFTAPAAVGLTRERPDKLGLTRMIHPDKYADTARLTRLQLYDPNRIPVIFVHGLQDTPASWVPMINALYEDPDIRRRYQFWVFSYPSGYPYPYCAALLRKELDGVNKAFPGHKKIVLIGHSMGGIISRLMITDAGDKIWRSYFGKSPAETNISGDARQLLEESLIFNHRPEVSRVVFICAPHRGAPMGANWIGQIGTRLVRMPFLVASVPFRVVNAAMVRDPSSATLNRMPTSIDTLSPNNRFVKEINRFRTTPGIPFHTIEGDRGRGDAPNSSDGVVPYWSSNLAGASSSLIVPSNHSAPRNPKAIAEVRRILHLHR